MRDKKIIESHSTCQVFNLQEPYITISKRHVRFVTSVTCTAEYEI